MMQTLETLVYELVKKNAYLKDFLVKIYQYTFSIFGLLKGRLICQYGEPKVIRNAFFGFHDRPSMNTKGEVISHIVASDFSDGSGTANIMITNVHEQHQRIVYTTNCCNYQQGSLATWFSDDEIIFNDMHKNQPITVILNIRNNEKRSVNNHFFSLSTNSRFISQISFARFGRGLKGYGYNVTYESRILEDAMISNSFGAESDFVIREVENNREVFRLSIQEAKTLSNGLIEDGYFYFSHSNFSPNSNKVYFLLRSSNKFYNSSQLFLYDMKNNKLITLPSGGMVSHLSWLGNDGIIAFCNVSNNDEYAYYHFNLINNNVVQEKNPLLKKDGHPHALDKEFYFTDTYPDRERRQYLFKVNFEKKSVEKILSIYSPLNYRGVIRVDFHPRVSMCKQYLTIDSSHNGDRSQLIISLNEDSK